MKTNPTIVCRGSFAECFDAFVAAVAEERKHDTLRPIVAVVGSSPVRRDLQRQLVAKLGGALNVRLYTPDHLAEELAAVPMAARGKRPATALYRQALIARLLRDGKGGAYFDAVAAYAGAARTLLETFTDLEEAGWERWPAGAPRTGKLGATADLFDAYRRELSAARFTPQDAYRLAAERAHSFAEVFGATALHVVGLYDANFIQRELLARLGGHVEVRLYLPAVLQPARLPWGEWLAEPTTQPTVWRIESCPDEAAEAREIVRLAKRLRREGTPYHCMGVLLRHVDAYADLLADVCREAQTPYRLETGCTPTDSPALRSLLRLTALIESRRGRGELLAFLGATPLPAHYPDYQKAAATQRRWDALSRRARLRQYGDWPERLRQLTDDQKASAEDRAGAGHLLAAGVALVGYLERIERAPSYRRAVAALCEGARHFIAPDECAERALETLSEAAALDEAGLPYAAATAKAHFAQLLREVRDDERGADDGLHVIGMSAARGLTFDVVFVPGCAEKSIPANVPPDPVLLDRERRLLEEATGTTQRLPLRTDRADDELRLFDLACRAARDKLILTYPRTESGGRTRLPSHLLLEAASRQGGKHIAYQDFETLDLVHVHPAGRYAPEDPAAALNADERRLALMRRLERLDPAAPILFLRRTSPRMAAAWRKQVARWVEREVGGYEGLCASPAALAALARRFAREHAWKVTDLEDYVKCPRRYLLGRLLALTTPEDPEEVLALGPDKRGQLVHHVLEQIEDFSRADLDAWVAARVDVLYADNQKDNRTGGGALDEVERERLTQWVRAMIAFGRAQSAAYTWIDSELKLDRQPVTLDESGRTERLTGRLDRIDEDAAGQRIVDYKTGKAYDPLTGKKLNAEDWNHGATLQLPLYLLAYAARHPQRAATLTAAYWYLKDKDGALAPTPLTFNSGFVGEKETILRAILAEVVDGLRGGRFAPRPDVAGKDQSGYCDHCDYKRLCDPLGRRVGAAKDRAGAHCPWLDKVGRIDE